MVQKKDKKKVPKRKKAKEDEARLDHYEKQQASCDPNIHNTVKREILHLKLNSWLSRQQKSLQF